MDDIGRVLVGEQVGWVGATGELGPQMRIEISRI